MQNEPGKLIFRGGLEGGGDSLFEIIDPETHKVKFILRRNAMTMDKDDNEEWVTSNTEFPTITAYLHSVRKHLPYYYPLKLDRRHARVFRNGLFTAIKADEPEALSSVFGKDRRSGRWQDWQPLLYGARVPHKESSEVFNLISRESVEMLRVRLNRTDNTQEFLDLIYSAMAGKTCPAGSYGKHWYLFNLTHNKAMPDLNREMTMADNGITIGDDLAVIPMMNGQDLFA